MTTINRRTFLRGLAAGTAAISFPPAARTEITEPRPNLVFLLVDDQRNDTLGCAGHPILKTPVIDSLAAAGVRFRNAFVTTSICAASRASIFTGLYERTHGYTFGTPPISADHAGASYPALLRRAGYRTGFVGKFGVNVVKGFMPEMFDYVHLLDRNPYFHKQPDGSLRHETDLAGDHAIEFLRDNPDHRPFCLSISFNAVHAEDNDKENHYPWPQAVDGMYDDVEIPPPRLSDPAIFESQPDFLKKSLNRQRYFWRWDAPEKYQKNMRAYFRMISGVDRVIGRIREELKNLNLEQNTIIIYNADNGYYMGNRGFAGKWSHYEESLRVPLIIYDPRIPQRQRGTVLDSMALNIDLPATMLEYAGVDVPESYQGRSLLPLAQGKVVDDWRTEFFCEHLMVHEAIPKWEGVRAERYVYARYFEQTPIFEFLHDLQTDPDQLRNFAASPEYAEVLSVMRKHCEEGKKRFENKK
ncbi:MAG: DUF4976 domain-containing protein [Candidatus Omnitrophota bacterium]|jgi:arylsulfatase A-like enzyme|nr:MAG: DUF4976 domain-containing protein [Candidatus Omnitrophota bacterium]